MSRKQGVSPLLFSIGPESLGNILMQEKVVQEKMIVKEKKNVRFFHAMIMCKEKRTQETV